MATQTIQFETVSPSEIGSGTVTAFLFSGATLVATLASISENATLKGRHTGTVEDIAAGTYRLVVKVNGYTISDPDEVVTLLLAVGTYVASRPAVLDAASLRVALGMAAADLDDQLDAILAGGGGGGAGTGARTVTITVDDGATALQNATVRMTEGVNTFTALTNASGIAVFNLDDATYTVSISKSGYSYAGTTLLVNGTETATYSMTAIVITPGADNLTTAWLVTRVAGVATEGITIRYEQAQEPDSDTGSSYDSTIYNVESDETGVAEMPMVKGGYYYVWRGTGKRPDSAQLLEIPANAGATYELPSHVGR
jgi:hypothetical protein